VEPSELLRLPALLFVLLGFFFLQKAVRPGARQSWSWGRGGGPVPVSRWGYAAWAATFFAIALVMAHGPRPSIAAVALFIVCFLATLGVGFIDTHRYRKDRYRSRTRD
jgi:Flp pilus assembly protein TadB